MSKVVFTNGCFDILHQGHYALFKYCRDLAGEDGKVVLGIDTDERIKENKGDGIAGDKAFVHRPYHNEWERHINLTRNKNPLNGKPFADDIHFFATDEDLIRLVKITQPDIMVKGSDWEGKHIIGGEHAKEIKYFGIIGTFSTTKVLKHLASGGELPRRDSFWDG